MEDGSIFKEDLFASIALFQIEVPADLLHLVISFITFKLFKFIHTSNLAAKKLASGPFKCWSIASKVILVVFSNAHANYQVIVSLQEHNAQNLDELALINLLAGLTLNKAP